MHENYVLFSYLDIRKKKEETECYLSYYSTAVHIYSRTAIRKLNLDYIAIKQNQIKIKTEMNSENIFHQR